MTPGIVRWDPAALAERLGVGAATEVNGKPYTAAVSSPRTPVAVAAYPDVQAALDKVSGDRSDDIYRVLGACRDAGFMSEEAFDVVRSRADLVEKLGEVGGDDLTRSWIKLLDKQQQLQFGPVVAPRRSSKGEPADQSEDPKESVLDRLAISGADLDDKQFDDLQFAVDGLISEGVGMLVGPPKLGKSWFVIDVALAVAAGGKALSAIDVDKRPVLYFALEDGERRLQDRSRRVCGGPIPKEITYITDANALEVITAAAEFMTRHRDEKPVIIIDTLGKIKRAKQPGEESYLVDYQMGTKLKALAALAPGSTILVVHHTRKAEAADFVDAVSGTHGLAGSVDFVIVLTRKRLSNDAVLSVTGRDIAEGEYALHADQGVLWRINGDDLAAARKLADEQKAKGSMGDIMLSVYEFVRDWDGKEAVGASDVAAKLTISADTARKNLNRLVNDGRINRVGRGRFQHFVSQVSQVSDSRRTRTSAGPEDRDTERDKDCPKCPEPGCRCPDGPERDTQDTQDSQDTSSHHNNVTPTCSRCGQQLLAPKSVARGYCEKCRVNEEGCGE
jgi:hypothetical protein